MPPSFLLFETGFAHLPPCRHFLSERLLRRSHLGEIFWNDRREMPALRAYNPCKLSSGNFFCRIRAILPEKRLDNCDYIV